VRTLPSRRVIGRPLTRPNRCLNVLASSSQRAQTAHVPMWYCLIERPKATKKPVAPGLTADGLVCYNAVTVGVVAPRSKPRAMRTCNVRPNAPHSPGWATSAYSRGALSTLFLYLQCTDKPQDCQSTHTWVGCTRTFGAGTCLSTDALAGPPRSVWARLPTDRSLWKVRQ
jgi:hypothetical protein